MVVEQNRKVLHLYNLTHEQQELLTLIYNEVSELLTKQHKFVSEIDNLSKDQQQLIFTLETQVNQANRIGSAAQMIGLQGLYQFCKHISHNFEVIKGMDPLLLLSLGTKLLYWPEVIQKYLDAPYKNERIVAAIKFLKQPELPVDLSQEELSELLSQFTHSRVDIDTVTDRIYEATPDLISLELSEEADKELLDSFIEELPRLAEELSNSVHKLQNDDFIKQLEVSERIAHTIKGAGNTVGIQGITNFTHYLESIFSSLLKAKHRPSKELHSTMQNATDCLEEMSEYLQGHRTFPEHTLRVFQELLDWVNKKDLQVIEAPESDLELKTSTHDALSDTEKYEENSHELLIEPKLQVSAHLVDDLLKRASVSIIYNEQIQELAMWFKSAIQQLSVSNKGVKAIAQELENKIELRSFVSDQYSSTNKDERFDLLEIDQFNELHTLTNQLLENADNSVEYISQIEEKALKLETLSVNQVRNLHENQEAVLRIRMIPVKTILPRLRRAVRQACNITGKLAQLEIFGEETLIDSEFIHQLANPIMHLLRNAVDHGIESSELRKKNNKDPNGKIQLSFKKEGNLIRVVCQDDGTGLDLKSIKYKSIEKGYLDKTENLTKEKAINLIQQHGFSTKNKVSQLSGRGVGLAAVSNKIHELKGSVNIVSDQGQGLRVDIVIPTTFNAVHALIVRCEDSKVAISNRGVVEIIYAGAGDVTFSKDQPFLHYMDQSYPLYDLKYMLSKTEHNRPAVDKIFLIINDDVNKKHAITVDEIFDTRDIVTKPLSKIIPKISGLHGTTILGDGSVTAVIDVVELLKNIQGTSQTYRQIIEVKKEQCQNRYALIVEDAISTRKSLAQFMRDLGFVVNTAKDGVEAIDQIQKQLPSIVLTDLEMPRMNGLELTDHLRSNAETASVPILMITSKSSEKHKNEAKRLGITAYITKPYDEDELLEIINTFEISK